jgi:hypothetical protein
MKPWRHTGLLVRGGTGTEGDAYVRGDAQGALDVSAGRANGILGLFLRNLVSRAYRSLRKPRFLAVLLGPAFDVPWVRELLCHGAVGGERNEGR